MAKAKREILIVEVDRRDVQTQEESKEANESIASLQGHPGFEELLRRFRIAQAQLRAQLEITTHESLQSVHDMQAAIKWLGFAERQLKQAVGRRDTQKPRAPYAEEQDEFDRLAKYVTLVGRNDQAV